MPDRADPDEQYYSYWLLIDFLVPNTHSKIEEHTTAEQGVSVFSPLDYDGETVVAGEKDEEKGEGDGGGLVPLSPWTGGRGGDDDRHVLLSPGTDTAWLWGVPPNAPPGSTEKTWYAREGQEFIEKKDDASIEYDPSDPRQFLPEDVNRVVEVGDLNGDGLNDLVYLTEKGTYISLTDDSAGTTNRYHPPVLLSNVVDDITDVVTLDYNKDGAQDLVLLTRDETKPNRIYYGDSRDPEMKNLGEKEHAAGVTENGVPGEPVGGLRYAPLGFDGVTYDANGVADEVNGVPATSKFRGTKVVGFDTDGDGVDDSFVVVTDQDDGGGASPEDELYLMGSKTPIKIPSSNTRTTDVVAVRLNNDPNEPVTLIFGKTGTGGAGAVNKYLQIPTQTNDHLIAGDAIEDPLVRYEHMTTFAELLDATNLGKMKYPDPTDPTGVTEVTPTGLTTTDWDAAEVRDTHSLKVIEVDDHVYLSGVAAGTTSRVHIYEGFTPAPDAATPTTDTHSGNYYHNPGTPADYPTAGTAPALATPASIVGTKTKIDAGTSDPDLQQVTELEVMQKAQDKPPVVLLLTKEGTKMVLTPYLETDTPDFAAPIYDGRDTSPTHNANIGTEMDILDAGGTTRSGVTDAQTSANTARDLKASHGLLVVADFDNDGHPDVLSGTHVVLSEEGLYHTGVDANADDAADNVPEERTPKKYWQGPAPLAVTALDVDEDGDVDIVALTRRGGVRGRAQRRLGHVRQAHAAAAAGAHKRQHGRRLCALRKLPNGRARRDQVAAHGPLQPRRGLCDGDGPGLLLLHGGDGRARGRGADWRTAAVGPARAGHEDGAPQRAGRAVQGRPDLPHRRRQRAHRRARPDGARGRGGRARRRRLGAAPRRGQRHGRRAARVQARRGRRQGRHAAGPGRQRRGR